MLALVLTVLLHQAAVDRDNRADNAAMPFAALLLAHRGTTLPENAVCAVYGCSTLAVVYCRRCARFNRGALCATHDMLFHRGPHQCAGDGVRVARVPASAAAAAADDGVPAGGDMAVCRALGQGEYVNPGRGIVRGAWRIFACQRFPLSKPTCFAD